ncbi:hypothetical protein DPM13_01045 [Paracoccus mutanolyticus]|uniref:Uncharacterized protein n=1 Tax=Paracoccus mutanolyticus TaxID=1499308 RepID=A0ABN5M971_9RHOB|nr:hypothetical protein DPM13_01045 [Paracoccus mutanolyticus]
MAMLAAPPERDHDVVRNVLAILDRVDAGGVGHVLIDHLDNDDPIEVGAHLPTDLLDASNPAEVVGPQLRSGIGRLRSE